MLILRNIALAALLTFLAAPTSAETIGDMDVCFTPGPDDCAMVAVEQINAAERTIDMQAYNFTEPHIAKALVAASLRGVHVRLISDKTGPKERGSKAMVLAQAGIPVWIDYEPHIAHNKVMVIDRSTVLTGSFNWSTAADKHNAENLLTIHDPRVAEAYDRNFRDRLEESETLAEYEEYAAERKR